MEIRKYQAEDLEEIVQLFYETIQTGIEKIIRRNRWKCGQTDVRILEKIKHFLKNFIQSLP